MEETALGDLERAAMHNASRVRSKVAEQAPVWTLVFVLLVATLVRLPTLTWYSLNADEGASLYYSSLPYSELVAHLADLSVDRHPLLYYILLKAWRQVAGDADFMLRLPSALAGLAVVALTYQIGRRHFGWITGGFAALLVALSPLAIYEDQDARMYAMASMFAVLAIWALWSALDRPGRRFAFRLAIFTVALTLAVYTQVIALLLFPALAVTLVWELHRDRRAAAWGMAATAASAVACLPYVINILHTNNTGSNALTASNWLSALLHIPATLLAYQVPLSLPSQHAVLLGLLVVAVTVGIWRGSHQGVALGAWFLVLLALTIFVSLRIDVYQTKSFIFVVAPLSLLLALACFGRFRSFSWKGAVPGLAIVGLLAFGLSYEWRMGDQRQDFRSAARFVQARVTEQDAVVLHLTWYRYVFGHYYTAPYVHPFANNVDSATPIEEVLGPYLDSDTLWLVQSGVGLPGTTGDPNRLVENWLRERYPVATEVFPHAVEVQEYVLRYRLESLPPSATPLWAEYPNGLTLVGYRLPETTLPTRDRSLHPPSTWVPVTLYWSVERPLDVDVRVSLSLEDEQGNVWGSELVRPSDVGAVYPPTEWQPGEIIRWDFDVNANPEVPAGEYKVVLRTFTAGSAAPLAYAEGPDWLIVDRVSLR